MAWYAVLTAVGPDRPGLVAELTEFLLKHGANVEDSRMAVLGGDFAVILLFSAPQQGLSVIEEEKEQLSARTGLTVSLRRTTPQRSAPHAALMWKLHAVSLDHPGIVHRLAHAVSRQGMNIIELQSHLLHAPVTAAPIFTLDMTVTVPGEKKPAALRESLLRLADEMGIDLEVRAQA